VCITDSDDLVSSNSLVLAGRFLIGFALGLQLPMLITLCTENTPNDKRGRVFVIEQIFFCIGMISVCVLSTLITKSSENGVSKLCLILLNVPNVFAALLALIYVKESPRYEIYEDLQEGLGIIEFMHKENRNFPIFICVETKIV